MQPVPALHTLVFDCVDAEAMTTTVQHARLDHLQLARGRFRGVVQQARLSATRLDRGCYNLPVLTRGPLAPDALTFGYFVHAPEGGVLNGRPVRSGDVAALAEGGELRFRHAPGTEWIAFHVPRPVFERLGVAVPGELHGMQAVSADHRQALALAMRELLPAFDGTASAAQLSMGLECAQEALIACCARILDGLGRKGALPPLSLPERVRIVRRAEEYMDAHLAEPVRVDSLCLAAGTSLRGLERAFLAVYGLGPKRYLTLRRLLRARRELRRADTAATVTDVALRWGFLHLGRFAADYRAQFGETPSETMRQARRAW